MTDEKRIDYSWANTFQDLKYQAELRGQNEDTFSTCRKCLEEGLVDFDEKDMLEQAKAFDITVLFVSCDTHAGATV
jgi:hypothetical protein